MKRRILAVILAGGMLFSTAGCNQQQAEETLPTLVPEEEEEAYPTTTVEYGDVVKHIKVRCNYESTEKQELSFAEDNRLIARVEVKMGDYVDAGQLLAALDVEDLEETIAEMEYQVSSLELRLKQTEEMRAFDLASAERLYAYTDMKEQDRENLQEKKESIMKQYQTALEDMTDQLSLQKKRLEQYREQLKTGCLYADITGEITYIDSNMKDTYSKKGRIVVTVSNLDACYFVADDVEYAECFAEGDSVSISYKDGGEDYVCEVVPALMETWDEKMYFKPVSEEFIPSGTNGTITMELARGENVLCIPEDAVHESDKGLFVYLEKDGLLEMRYVTVGLEGDTLVEITEGLEQGEVIALKK